MNDYLRGLGGPTFTELNTDLNSLYFDHKCDENCCHAEPVEALPALAADNSLADIIAAMVRQVYTTRGLPADLIDAEVVANYAQTFWEGVEKGLAEVDYTTPDEAMIRSLRENVWQFSAAKNYNQLVELSKSLVDEDGKLRSWQAFRQEAYSINDAHINQWLKAEYNQAVAGSQMDAKWQQIESDKAALPMLEFDAIMDGRTTEICASLNGTRKPVDDPFWNTWYPPNHWGCRSTVRQLAGGKPTPDSKIIYPDDTKIPPMFKTNLGKQKIVFPKDHPYFENCPPEVLKEASAEMLKQTHRKTDIDLG